MQFELSQTCEVSKTSEILSSSREASRLESSRKQFSQFLAFFADHWLGSKHRPKSHQPMNIETTAGQFCGLRHELEKLPAGTDFYAFVMPTASS